MKMYVILYDNGHDDYVMNDKQIYGVYDSREEAVSFVVSIGFKNQDGNFFVRDQDNVLGGSVEHREWIDILEFELNKPIDDYVPHYKNEDRN